MEDLTEMQLFEENELPVSVDVRTPDLAARFGIAPFSVLNTREGWWQDRKEQWYQLGLRSHLGRDVQSYGGKNGKDEISAAIAAIGGVAGASVFDPVLCELLVRWFSPADGLILDPFAGGSVRGLVSSHLGRTYYGIDVYESQIAANVDQAVAWIDLGLLDSIPTWVAGDGRDPNAYLGRPGHEADMILTCPPYYDLEKYGDDPRDLSTMTVRDFEQAIRDAVAVSCERLALNSYSCWVVGDVRDRKGALRNFPGLVIEAHKAAGLTFHNDLQIINMVGSLAARVGKQWETTRKIGRNHQVVLVFLKGNPKDAANRMDPDPTRTPRKFSLDD